MGAGDPQADTGSKGPVWNGQKASGKPLFGILIRFFGKGHAAYNVPDKKAGQDYCKPVCLMWSFL